jgi:iron complex transport system substrate-binding protein
MRGYSAARPVAWALILLLVLIGCGEGASHSSNSASQDPHAGSASYEAEVTIPQRVVVVGPSTAETLFALGVGDRIVGVSDFCRDPRAQELDRVGGQFDPNLERITALNPDIVLTQGDNQALRELCARLKVPFLSLKTDSVKSWLEEVKQLGEIFQMQEQATALTESFQAEFNLHLTATKSRHPLVVILIARNGVDGMIAVGSGSFLHELLAAAGGRNAFANNREAYFNLSQEALLNAAPDVLLDLTIPTSTDPLNVVAPSNQKVLEVFAKAFPTLPAVVNQEVFVLNDDYLFLPGPRMLETVRAFHRCWDPR